MNKNLRLIITIVLVVITIGSCSVNSRYYLKSPKVLYKHLSIRDSLNRIEDKIKIASWYGRGFQKKKTSSGERFNQYSLTAAHKTLRFGTKLRITNLDNNKSVIVRVNDRGPYIEDRDIDLSYKAMKILGGIKNGIIHINCKIINWIWMKN